MSARQEHCVDFVAHADFTRLGVVKSMILLHQHLLLVVCQQRKFDYVHTFCFLQTLFFISLPPPRRLCFHMCLFCLKQEYSETTD